MALIRYKDRWDHTVWEERTAESCAPQRGDLVKFPDHTVMRVTEVLHNLSHNKFDRFIEVEVTDKIKGEASGQDS